MAESKYTKPTNQLCWNCKRSCAPDEKKCSWAAAFIPVPGWDATKTILREHSEQPIESYDIKGCPLYQKDKPFTNRKEAVEAIAQKVNMKPVTVIHRLKKYAAQYEKLTQTKIPEWVFESVPRGRFCSKSKSDGKE